MAPAVATCGGKAQNFANSPKPVYISAEKILDSDTQKARALQLAWAVLSTQPLEALKGSNTPVIVSHGKKDQMQ